MAMGTLPSFLLPSTEGCRQAGSFKQGWHGQLTCEDGGAACDRGMRALLHAAAAAEPHPPGVVRPEAQGVHESIAITAVKARVAAMNPRPHSIRLP